MKRQIIAVLILAAGTTIAVAETPHTFETGEVISAAQMNENFQHLLNLIVPIGTILAWHRDLADVALPHGWVELRGQTIENPDSPYFGKAVPDLNSSGRFLRGGPTSGVLQDHAVERHTHSFTRWYRRDTVAAGLGGSQAWWQFAEYDAETFYHGPFGNFDHETRPINMSVVWIMRVL